MGFGGSIFQRRPGREIGFAFGPTALHLLDVLNERGEGVSGGSGALRGAAAERKAEAAAGVRVPLKVRKRSSRLLAVALAFVTASGFACERIVEEDLEIQEAEAEEADGDAAVVAEVEACRQNAVGMRSMARSALNAASNPLADRVGAMNWEAFCGCFAPELAEVVKSRRTDSNEGAEPSYAEYEVLRDAIAVRCAAAGIPDGAAARPSVESHPSGGLAVHDAKFAPIVDHCVASPAGYLTNVRVHLEVQRSPRAVKAMEMLPSAYCPCYVAQMRRGLGDDLAHLYLASVRPPGDLDFIAIGAATDDAYDTCAAELIPFPTRGAE